MRIKTSKKIHVLSRYSGLSDDKKTTEARIASIPIATKPDEIPNDVKDNLTPKELRELKNFLQHEEKKIAQEVIGTLLKDLIGALNYIKKDFVDDDIAAILIDAIVRIESLEKQPKDSTSSLNLQRIETSESSAKNRADESSVNLNIDEARQRDVGFDAGISGSTTSV